MYGVIGIDHGHIFDMSPLSQCLKFTQKKVSLTLQSTIGLLIFEVDH